LGDIPVLGWLFRNRTVRITKKNLVVFLTPKIIRNSEGHKKILHDKMADRIDWIKQNSGGRDPYGAKFNSMIHESKAVIQDYSQKREEIELDLEEATPLGAEPELESERF